MWIGIISLFPKMFKAIVNFGITSKAIRDGLLHIEYWNPRDFSEDEVHNTVADRPYGGGSGMLIMANPLKQAICAAKNQLLVNNSNNNAIRVKVILLSPQGRRLDYYRIRELSLNTSLILVCGRYEGIDERLILNEIDEEWSIGDYVISGGELAAMVLVDAMTRLLPGVLNNKMSIIEDSFVNNMLDYPNYTRPRVFEGIKVPEVLLSGNHKEIVRWRLKQSLGHTWLKRPDLIESLELSKDQIKLLNEFILEY